ncbi:hypothetical protein GCM10009127_06610 [Alteraurantiacibacter aestuarii]|uniref:Uncharacterized protein n=1 Tax=Alteraurantiacibacter aestuarii TaxID=650004 RepID=A0A844ZMZ5_9SPHN|nr:hypothetical protein [Alteraurantiacibacter aestuarii]MXO89138.1 hypothetical protein [Alteraurantiacibacter aestuarii]
MAKALLWSLCTYLVLKFLQYFFVARPGFGTAEPTFRDKLLRGEPLLFIVACALAVPAALWSTWYFQRGFERGLEHSADCFGRVGALQSLGELEREFDPLRVSRGVQAARQSVFQAEEWLELTPDDAEKLMADKLNFYTRRYSTLSRQGDRREIRALAAAIERCLSEPLIDF